jgi:hypothetical protein
MTTLAFLLNNSVYDTDEPYTDARRTGVTDEFLIGDNVGSASDVDDTQPAPNWLTRESKDLS